MEYQEIKNPLNLDVVLKNDGSKKNLSNDCLITGAYVSSMFCSCKFHFQSQYNFSDVDGLLISDRSGDKVSSLCCIFFSNGSSLSVIWVFFRVAECCNSVLLLFLVGFFVWLWN